MFCTYINMCRIWMAFSLSLSPFFPWHPFFSLPTFGDNLSLNFSMKAFKKKIKKTFQEKKGLIDKLLQKQQV